MQRAAFSLVSLAEAEGAAARLGDTNTEHQQPRQSFVYFFIASYNLFNSFRGSGVLKTQTNR